MMSQPQGRVPTGSEDRLEPASRNLCAPIVDCGRRIPQRGRSLPRFRSVCSMEREKATITVDREKLSEARAILGVSSASAAIDVALSEFIRRRRLRNDLKAYAGPH